MFSSIILGTIWTFISGILAQFWGWILGGAVALLAFLFSPSIRKYTLGALAILAIAACIFLYGYNQGAAAHQVDVCKYLMHIDAHQGDTSVTMKEIFAYQKLVQSAGC